MLSQTPNRKSLRGDAYAVEQPEKEQEVIPTVTSMVVADVQGGAMTSLERLDMKVDSPRRGKGSSRPVICTGDISGVSEPVESAWRTSRQPNGPIRYFVQKKKRKISLYTAAKSEQLTKIPVGLKLASTR